MPEVVAVAPVGGGEPGPGEPGVPPNLLPNQAAGHVEPAVSGAQPPIPLLHQRLSPRRAPVQPCSPPPH
eukprot:14190182-Alexandrium_andersonii.AAC.1